MSCIQSYLKYLDVGSPYFTRPVPTLLTLDCTSQYSKLVGEAGDIIWKEQRFQFEGCRENMSQEVKGNLSCTGDFMEKRKNPMETIEKLN